MWLPSINGEKEYLKIDVNFNKNYFIYPLIFKDELTDTINLKEKKYFSYIATVDDSKRFKEFLSFIKYYNKKNDKIKFLIATKSNIDIYLDKELKFMINNGTLKVRHGVDLNNSEINRHIIKVGVFGYYMNLRLKVVFYVNLLCLEHQ